MTGSEEKPGQGLEGGQLPSSGPGPSDAESPKIQPPDYDEKDEDEEESPEAYTNDQIIPGGSQNEGQVRENQAKLSTGMHGDGRLQTAPRTPPVDGSVTTVPQSSLTRRQDEELNRGAMVDKEKEGMTKGPELRKATEPATRERGLEITTEKHGGSMSKLTSRLKLPLFRFDSVILLVCWHVNSG